MAVNEEKAQLTFRRLQVCRSDRWAEMGRCFWMAF